MERFKVFIAFCTNLNPITNRKAGNSSHRIEVFRPPRSVRAAVPGIVRIAPRAVHRAPRDADAVAVGGDALFASGRRVVIVGAQQIRLRRVEDDAAAREGSGIWPLGRKYVCRAVKADQTRAHPIAQAAVPAALTRVRKPVAGVAAEEGEGRLLTAVQYLGELEVEFDFGSPGKGVITYITMQVRLILKFPIAW